MTQQQTPFLQPPTPWVRTRTTPALTATAPSPHISPWSVTCESIAQRLTNQCQKDQSTPTALASTANTALAPLRIAWAYSATYASTRAELTTTPNPITTSRPITVIATDTDTTDVACPHCPRTFTSRIGLVGHLRIHRTGTGEPVPEAPIYAHQAHLHCPRCPRTFTHRMAYSVTCASKTTCVDNRWLHHTSTHTPYLPPPLPPHINTHPPYAPNCHLPRRWEVCISTRSPCDFGCTGDLSLRLSRHLKRRP
nr:unnamed protein product [Spirometra erinaceieuropaei]